MTSALRLEQLWRQDERVGNVQAGEGSRETREPLPVPGEGLLTRAHGDRIRRNGFELKEYVFKY